MKDQKQLLLKSLNNDVPVFVICGTDENAIEAMNNYFQIAQKNGCDNAFLHDMKLVIEDFKAFKEQEPEKVKLPDMSPQIESTIYSSKDNIKVENEKTQLVQTENSKPAVEDEIFDYLKFVEKTDLLIEVNNSPYNHLSDEAKQFVSNYFAPDIYRIDNFHNQPIEKIFEDTTFENEVSCIMKLKAGELLESEGILPLGATQTKLENMGWNIVNLRKTIDNDILLDISKSDNALARIYELHGNNEELISKFTQRNGLSQVYYKAENSAMEVSDHDRFVSNFYEDPDTTSYPNREEIEKIYDKAQNTAIQDKIALKQAVCDKANTLKKQDLNIKIESFLSM